VTAILTTGFDLQSRLHGARWQGLAWFGALWRRFLALFGNLSQWRRGGRSWRDERDGHGFRCAQLKIQGLSSGRGGGRFAQHGREPPT